ncbi:hypothetical protein XMIN_3677 [Xanthomonas citri pv. mangiferaeindicae LMG 941]|nr:hypothetical protein XMIN_3677 [Xanthomonas citri pv. mangiferaeindicae LMG 941]
MMRRSGQWPLLSSAEALARMSAAGDLKRGVREARAWLKHRYPRQWYAGRY